MADYVGVLADLKAKRTALDEERAELETLIQGVERLVARIGIPMPTIGASVLVTPVRRAWGRLTMPQAVKAHFNTIVTRELQTTKQVVESVRAGGIKGGANLRGHVYNTLERLSKDDGPFVKHPDGRWSLREWNLPVGESTANRPIDLLHSVSR